MVRLSKKQTKFATIRHSAAHLLAAAVLELFPEAKLGTGPAIEGGFYYDFELPRTLQPEDLILLQKKMQQLIKQNLAFIESKVSIEVARKKLKKTQQRFKLELLADLQKAGLRTVSFYKVGAFEDLCAGPHVARTTRLAAFKLTKIAGSYWRGEAQNPRMQRIYGVAFEQRAELAKWEELQREARKRDHRRLGERLGLFTFHEAAPGSVFWSPRGKFVYEGLIQALRAENSTRGYQEIKTPTILSSQLWRKSGHYENFQENMYFTKFEGREFAVKPMNCPGCCLLLGERKLSYRELPLRLAEFGTVHRLELSGVLHGLLRVREFTQDDAHIFCLPEQLEAEIEGIIEYTLAVYRKFGFREFEIFLATRPAKALGSEALWRRATLALKRALKRQKIKYGVKEGEGAFYGPKIEFNVRDALRRNWQLGTCQIDFNLPERFDLSFVARQGQSARPVLIHRAIVGSLERFLAILIEHTAGELPLNLQPELARFIPVAVDFLPQVRKVFKEFRAYGQRVRLADSADSLGKKIRAGEMAKVPFLVVVGEKELNAGKLTVRVRGEERQRFLSGKGLRKLLGGS